MIYKEDKYLISIIMFASIIVGVSFWIFCISFDKELIRNYTTNVITFTSITMGFYIASISSLLSSKYIRTLNKEDKQITGQLQIHTVIYYFKYSIYSSLSTIILSFILMFNNYFYPSLSVVLLTITTGTIGVNVLFIYIILKLLSNALIIQIEENNKKENEK